MIQKGKCALCGEPSLDPHWTCIYCREFMSDHMIFEVDAFTEDFLAGELELKKFTFFLAEIRDIRDANWLCELYLPDVGEEKKP